MIETESSTTPGRLENAVVVQSLGFSGDFVIRTITKHDPSRLVLIAIYSDEKSWRKVMNAFNDINSLCSRLGIDVRLEKIEVADSKPLQEIVYDIRKILVRELKNNPKKPLLLVPMGGPRILTIALLLAAMGLSKYLRSRVFVRVEGEAFDYTYTTPLEDMVPVEISEDEREVLRELIESYRKGKGLEGIGPSDLSKKMNKPRATVHRRLTVLVNKGLASVEEGKYKPTPRGFLSA